MKLEYIQILRKVIGIGLNICAMIVMFTKNTDERPKAVDTGIAIG